MLLSLLSLLGGSREELVEDFAYQKRLQLYKGEIGPEDVLSDDAEPLDVATQGGDHPCLSWPYWQPAKPPPLLFVPALQTGPTLPVRWPA